MGWNDEETKNAKKGMSTSSKILLAIIVCILAIIMLLIMALNNTQAQTSFRIYINGEVATSMSPDMLITTVDNETYVDIEAFSKLVGYEFHKGEYKASTIDENKCYVESKEETASFYLNDNTIYKLLPGKRDEQYSEIAVYSKVINLNNKMYASVEAISKAFNVIFSLSDIELQIYTLSYMENLYDAKVKEWGYTGIKEQNFENKKSILQGCLIVKKEGGLYKVIDVSNTKEIILDRYKSIEFSENTQEFFVTNDADKMGIFNLDGTIKLDAVYDSIDLLDRKSDLYIVKQYEKFGVVSGKGNSIIYPEYDSIGLDGNNLILDELIPVCKDGKWGAFNKTGNRVLNVEYDELGYNSHSIEINGVKEVVKPVLTIERANGIVVKKFDKYGLINVVNGKEMVKVIVDGIYEIIGEEDEDAKYYMLYNGQELNVIERLIVGGYIQQKTEEEDIVIDNNINNNIDNLQNNVDEKVNNSLYNNIQ